MSTLSTWWREGCGRFVFVSYSGLVFRCGRHFGNARRRSVDAVDVATPFRYTNLLFSTRRVAFRPKIPTFDSILLQFSPSGSETATLPSSLLLLLLLLLLVLFSGISFGYRPVKKS